ncbi:hypothetical protein BDN72DRAFT_865134 [Pluteus cervinus]|uniref:Uncharacterized protein n=1 Tax=Pluteus cervinus TaxID=181527 RepID=A0ACD3A0Y6_9AGAR|nr:hypothetical protein BDN72DRAFT_865134 [Pluteus cervinus]
MELGAVWQTTPTHHACLCLKQQRHGTMSQPVKLTHIGPAELKSDPNLLIHSRNPSLPIGPFDGLIGAVIDNGIHFLTSPNEKVVYEGHITPRDIHMRNDFRYGEDDPTLWPQRYMAQACHLAAIPRRPDDQNDPLQLFWKDFEEADFIPVDDTLLGGLGHPSPDLISQLKAYVDKLNGAITQYQEIKKEQAANQVIFLRRAFYDSKTRFLSLALTFEQLKFSWTDVQRLYLELQAALDFAVKFRPRMTGEIWYDPTLPPARTVGTITSNPAVLQQMYSAGLPVWLIRRPNSKERDCSEELVVDYLVSSAVASVRVDAVTDARQPADFLVTTHADPPHPIIYSGHPNDYQIYVAMKFYHRSWFRPADPFQTPTNVQPNVISSRDARSNPTVSNTPSPELAYLTNPICPPKLEVWRKAIVEVTVPNSHYPAKFWRTLLTYGGEEVSREGEGTLSAERRNSASKLLVECGVTVGPWNTISYILWRGQRIEKDVHPDDATLTEILWEVNELNFRYDLLGLHLRLFRRRRRDPVNDVEDLNVNEDLVAACFPSTGGLNVADIDKADRGLASRHLQTRRCFLKHFALVLNNWPNCPDLVTSGASNSNRMSNQEVTLLEAASVKFFVNTFIREYGRLPAIPFSLS